MPAYSIHLGLNAVDPRHYNGWTGDLAACEFDAKDMALMARAAGYRTSTLLTAAATSGTLLGLLRQYADALRSGDRLLLSFAGHGAQVRDRDGEESDGADETWVMHDRMLVDDEIYAALCRFARGVRVVVVADSCHSGTSVRVAPSEAAQRVRAMPPAIAAAVYSEHGRTYAIARAQAFAATSADPVCTGLQLAACQDSQLAMDGDRNGLFTGTLKRVWAGGRFGGSYADAIRAARSAMPSYQTPSFMKLGRSSPAIELDRLFA